MRATPSWHCVRALEALKPKSHPIVLFFFFLKRWFVSFVRSSIGRCE